MEKLKFTIRFVIILAALPVIMFTELTRNEKGASEQRQNEKVSVGTNDNSAALSYTSFFTQAVVI